MNHAPDPPASESPARRTAKLSDAQREWIVRRLAADHPPSAIRRDVRERFGIAISLDAIARYDPTRDLKRGKRWVALFCGARKDHIKSRADLIAGARQVERVALRIVETLERRILAGPGSVAKGGVRKTSEITDADRLRALLVFAEKLRITDPAGFAEIRRVLCDGRARPSRRRAPAVA
jgi:hypothetical protein